MKNFYSQIKTLTLLLLTTVSILASAQSSAPPLVRLSINTATFNDETVFYFQEGGTIGFQSAFDAYKLLSNPNQGVNPYIASLSDSILTSISGLPALPVNLSIPVKAISPVTRTYTFMTQQSDFPANVCVTLYDAFTGISTNILTSNYVCTLYDTTHMARFKMNFFTTALNATSLVKQGDCSSHKGNMITAKGSDSGPWNYEWRKDDTLIKSCFNKGCADSVPFLKGGNYSLRISSVSQCKSFTKNFTLNEIVVPTADFTPDVLTTHLSSSGHVNFKNNSTNALMNSWNFGDNSGTWFIPSPSHEYQAAGIYTVTLISESMDHCKDTATQVIQIIDDITGIRDFKKTDKVFLATVSQGNYSILFNLDAPTDFQTTLFDLNGNLLKQTYLSQVTNLSQVVDLEHSASGMYLLKVTSGENFVKTFKLTK